MKQGKEFWNSVATRYQSNMSIENEIKYSDDQMKYLISKGAIAPEYTVADIGCAVGKYAVRFASEGCNLLLIDISDCMLDYSKKNLENSNTDWRMIECDFNETDIEAEGLGKSADLVFASLTPAISSDCDIDKMCKMSRQHCFLSAFAKGENKFLESICKELGTSSQFGRGNRYPYLDMANHIKELGYLPEITYGNYNWTNDISSQEMVDKLFEYNRLGLEDTVENRKRVFAAVSHVSDENGIVHEEVKTKMAWLYWDVTI